MTGRVDRRPEPRLAVALAAAGCLLAVIGVLVIATDPLVDSGDGDPNRIPGLLASLLLIAVGLALVAITRDGPLTTAGVVASALGIPPLLLFATFDVNDFPPFNVDVVLGVSALAWLALYLLPPGKGHAFYLGAGLFGLWLYALEAVEGLFSAPFDLFSAFAFGFSPQFQPVPAPDDFDSSDPFTQFPSEDPFRGFDAPDPTTLAAITLFLAVAFLAAAFLLDRRGRVGMATPFTLAGIVLAPVGLLFLADDLGTLGTGLAFTALGLAFATGGAWVGRRWTTWFGGVLVVQGLATVGSELVGDDASATTVGLVLMALGLVAVAGGWVVTGLLGEPYETVEGPTRFVLGAGAGRGTSGPDGSGQDRSGPHTSGPGGTAPGSPPPWPPGPSSPSSPPYPPYPPSPPTTPGAGSAPTAF
ncbi:MAG: hypothetical protein JNK12_15740 [Acidimicrobiales bacterium]|nr:hypothetical protein [Acidimicrobiales bacterium]